MGWIGRRRQDTQPVKICFSSSYSEIIQKFMKQKTRKLFRFVLANEQIFTVISWTGLDHYHMGEDWMRNYYSSYLSLA